MKGQELEIELRLRTISEKKGQEMLVNVLLKGPQHENFTSIC